MTTQLSGKHEGGLAGADIKKNISSKKSSSDQKVQEANNNKSDLSIAPVNKIQPAGQQNITNTKNESPGNSGTAKNRIHPESDLPGKNNPVQSLVSVNPDQRNASSGEDHDGSDLTMQKSSAQELQTVDSQNNTDPKQISALPGSHAPVLLIAATGASENVPHLRDENAVLRENEDQTDNAISVVALNDKNKGITKLFKKLTRRTPADENARKVRVSVFQFSY
ncbi:MAG: hypothetical protein WDM78_09505 [Puia sp.]